MAFSVDGDAVLDWLRRCGIEAPTGLRRVVIDLQVGTPARIYLDSFPGKDILFCPLALGDAELIERKSML